MITAVELMLERFDRRISDRYKLIDYKEDDFQKEIVYFSSSYFAGTTVPIVLGKIYCPLLFFPQKKIIYFFSLGHNYFMLLPLYTKWKSSL